MTFLCPLTTSTEWWSATLWVSSPRGYGAVVRVLRASLAHLSLFVSQKISRFSQVRAKILWSLCLVVFHALTLKLNIQTSLSVVPKFPSLCMFRWKMWTIHENEHTPVWMIFLQQRLEAPNQLSCYCEENQSQSFLHWMLFLDIYVGTLSNEHNNPRQLIL